MVDWGDAFKVLKAVSKAADATEKFVGKTVADMQLAQQQKIRERHETLGPYSVLFDSRIIDRVKIEKPISGRKTLSGTNYTIYPMLLYNSTTHLGIVSIARFEKPENINISDCSRDTESVLRSKHGYRDIKTALRNIDNKEGCVSVGRAQGKRDCVVFSYYPNRLTAVDAYIFLPWNQGASEMVDTFHVEDESVDPNPQDGLDLTDEGTVLKESGKYEDAIHALDKAIEINPQDATAWYGKGLVLDDQGKLDEAIKAYDMAIEINPQYSDALNAKGNALGQQGNYNESLNVLSKVIEINPHDAETWYNKGIALYHLGKLDEAIKTYDMAIKLNPQLARAWYNKGLALDNQGKLDEAIKAYDMAIKLNPQYLEACCNKGSVLGQQGKYDEALEAFEMAIKINPQLGATWYYKANTLKLLGRSKEADAAFAKAKEFGSTLP